MTAQTVDAESLPIDVAEIIDNGAWGGLQRFVVMLAALSIVLDGFDGQLIGYAIPVLVKQWGVSRAAFAPVVAAGLLGMGIGSVAAGYFADRFGRRSVIIASVFIFAVGTAAIGLANGVFALALLRFAAGLGIGGALPTSTTLTAEFTPSRRRTLAVTATIVCVPLGGMLAGLYAGEILPALGWRALFAIGGMVSLGLGLALVVFLPESPRYLIRRQARWTELRRLLERMSLKTAAGARFCERVEEQTLRPEGFGGLFGERRTRDTLALWTAFFLCLLAVYAAFSWLPTVLTAQGLSLAVAVNGLTAYNAGGVLGALLCAGAIARFGSRWPLLACCIGAAVTAFVLRAAGTDTPAVLVGTLALHGFFVNAVQSTMYALSAFMYPTAIRATGTAAALGFGRCGALASAFAGASVIAGGGVSAYFAVLGTAMAGVFVALAVVRRHIPRQARVNVT